MVPAASAATAATAVTAVTAGASGVVTGTPVSSSGPHTHTQTFSCLAKCAVDLAI